MIVTLVAVLILCAFALTACDSDLESKLQDLQNKINGYEQDFSEKSITVYIGEKEFEVVSRKAFLHDVLKDLESEGKISAYEFSGGNLSPFITQIDELNQVEAEYKYYSVWHNVNEYSLKSVYTTYVPSRAQQKVEGEGAYATVFAATTYEGCELYYSAVGVGLLPLVDGAVYAILVD